MQEVKEFPTTNTQFVSHVGSFIRGMLGANLIGENDNLHALSKSSVSFNLKIKKDSTREDAINDSLKEHLATMDIVSALASKDQPHWTIYYLLKGGETLGKFNVDIYPGEKADSLLVTFSVLNFD
jgi:hypothetical protein